MLTLSAMFIELAQENPVVFVSIVVAVIVSIVLHELAHGWAAIWQGDDTPIVKGHMTPNPIVHMGWTAIILLCVVGIAWGMMPVNPTKFRSKYGDALVAAAGPAMNLLLAIVAIVAYGLWVRLGGLYEVGVDAPLLANSQQLLWLFGNLNGVLLLLNLIPFPPLDGSRILADLHPPYRRWINSVQDPTVFMIGIVVIFVGLSYTPYGLFDLSAEACGWLARLIIHT